MLLNGKNDIVLPRRSRSVYIGMHIHNTYMYLYLYLYLCARKLMHAWDMMNIYIYIYIPEANQMNPCKLGEK